MAPVDPNVDPAAAAAPAPAVPADPNAVRPRLIPGSDETSGEIEASPEEHGDLDQVISKAMTMIHGKKSRKAVVESLHNPRDSVAEVVGRITANILMSISEQKLASTGQPVDKEILREAASYVVPELMTVGSAAGIFPFDDGEGDKNGEVGGGNTEYDSQVRLALLEAVKVYGERRLREPGAKNESDAAADEWATQVTAEVQSGTADPEYMAIARPTKLIPEGAPA